jgi:hypothetical protein
MRLVPFASMIAGLVVAGCTAAPALAPRPEAVGQGVTLRVQPAVRAGGLRPGALALQAFSPFGANVLHRLLVTVVDVTATPMAVATVDASDTIPLFSARGQTGLTLTFGNLRPYRRYRVAVEGFGRMATTDKVTVDDLSSTIVDTMPIDASGAIPVAYELAVPVQLIDRPFAGRLEVTAEGHLNQTGMVVALQGFGGMQALTDLVATTVVGTATTLVAFEGLAIDSTYRVVRRPFVTTSGNVIAAQVASAVVVTASTSVAVEESGDIASATLVDNP